MRIFTPDSSRFSSTGSKPTQASIQKMLKDGQYARGERHHETEVNLVNELNCSYNIASFIRMWGNNDHFMLEVNGRLTIKDGLEENRSYCTTVTKELIPFYVEGMTTRELVFSFISKAVEQPIEEQPTPTPSRSKEWFKEKNRLEKALSVCKKKGRDTSELEDTLSAHHNNQ